MRKKALIVGALGVGGKGLLNHLLQLSDWDTVALSLAVADLDLVELYCCFPPAVEAYAA